MITGFGNDWVKALVAYCKFRWYAIQVFAYISFTCMCFATIDQFLATCSRIYWQQFNSMKLSRRLCIITSIAWIIYGIPYLVFYNHSISSNLRDVSCVNTNQFFRQYRAYVNNILLTILLPEAVSVSFGALAYRIVRRIAYSAISSRL